MVETPESRRGELPIDGQGFESIDMRDHREECVIDVGVVHEVPIYEDVQGRRFRTLDVCSGFLDIMDLQVGPQRGTGYEHVPPGVTHVGERD